MPRTRQADNKTRAHDGDVDEFLAAVEHAGRREDAYTLAALMQSVTGEEPRMWGPSIVGFGQYHYVYASGREGDSFLVGFSPRKANMVVYIMPGFAAYADLLDKLGKFKSGSSCLYLGRLQNVDIKVLQRLLDKSVKDMRRKYV